MLCQICKKNKAIVKIIKISGINKTELNVCNECANYLLGNTVSSFSFHKNDINKVLGSLLNAFSQYSQYGNQQRGSSDGEEIKCPNCGMNYREFAQRGKLGCAQCYEIFQKELNPLLVRLHGHSQHIGKVPPSVKSRFDQLKRIKEIKNELHQAVLKEEYEKAAKLRDVISEEEKRLGIKKNG